MDNAKEVYMVVVFVYAILIILIMVCYAISNSIL